MTLQLDDNFQRVHLGRDWRKKCVKNTTPCIADATATQGCQDRLTALVNVVKCAKEHPHGEKGAWRQDHHEHVRVSRSQD